MSDLQYHRPKTLKEALKLLDQGIPLAGGTALIPKLMPNQMVIDLQELGLDKVKTTKSAISAGAALTLQGLLDSGAPIPEALAVVCHLEANLNLRNMATLGGSIISADGRSPLMTALLALAVEIRLEPEGEKIPLDSMLDRRSQDGFKSLIVEIMIPRPARLAYDQVARAPHDRPIVCAAVGMVGADYCIALGGFGSRPVRIPEAEEMLRKGDGVQAIATAAQEVYAKADDHWASGEYRGHVAATLVQRLLTEVMS
jgi:CO/xanthine dehydrogenase FAD-binding subunit